MRAVWALAPLLLSSCAAQPDDPCTPYPCSGPGTECVVAGDFAVCRCAAGFVEQNSGCVSSTSCEGHPCTAPHRTVCADEGSRYVCLCDPGYPPTDGGCADHPVWECARQHQGAGQDSFEPDECPPLAREILADGALQGRTLAPAGDEDWLLIASAPDSVVELAVSASAPVLLDAFLKDGVTLLAADHRGLASAAFRFVAPAGSYVRASGTQPVTYSVAMRDLGPDDFPNQAEASPRFMPGSTVRGAVQYPDDDDYFQLKVEGGKSATVALAADSSLTIAVQVFDLDGKKVLGTLEVINHQAATMALTPASSGAYTFRACAKAPGDRGLYWLTL